MGETVAIIALVLVAWLIYLLPAVPLSLPLWYFGRRRAQFMWWEASVLLLPFIIWLCSSFLLSPKDKSLGNLMVIIPLR